MKSAPRLSTVSLLLSASAVLVAGYAAWDLHTTARETRRAVLADPAEDLLDARLAELEQSLKDLQRTALEDRPEGREALAPAMSPLPGVHEDRVAELLARVEQLENDGRPDLERIDGPRETEGDSALARLEEELRHTSIEAALASYRARFLDPTTDELMRLETLRMLRLFPAELDPIDAGVVDGILDLAQQAASEKARDHAVGALRDTTDERIVDPLLQILAGDASPQVRGRAARILGGFRHLERVERTLRSALELETDPRAEADIRVALGLLRKGGR